LVEAGAVAVLVATGSFLSREESRALVVADSILLVGPSAAAFELEFCLAACLISSFEESRASHWRF